MKEDKIVKTSIGEYPYPTSVGGVAAVMAAMYFDYSIIELLKMRKLEQEAGNKEQGIKII